MLTDAWFTSGNDKMVKLLLKNDVRTYMYVLNYTIEGLNLPEWIGTSSIIFFNSFLYVYLTDRCSPRH